MKNTALWVTRTGVFIALLIVLQAVTTPLGTTLVTGSFVNMMLILSVMLCGFSSGAAVGLVSPVLAKCLGIGPFWSLIPFILAGNLTLIVIWYILGRKKGQGRFTWCLIACLTAAAAKFLVLYLGIVKIAVPLILELPQGQAAAVSGLFSVPQLITALAGGALAILLLPSLRKALSFSEIG
ncbi:ECF transporter S component [Anaerolentibacter hominis]|uniref:ECF transporter S component n=1 Tax=Anaerolentibacter hominis TaxID=3079009 RepID=UPI0031B85CE7